MTYSAGACSILQDCAGKQEIKGKSTVSRAHPDDAKIIQRVAQRFHFPHLEELDEEFEFELEDEFEELFEFEFDEEFDELFELEFEDELDELFEFEFDDELDELLPAGMIWPVSPVTV